MNRKTYSDSVKIRRLRDLYNAVPNFFWSAVCLIPVYLFCYRFIELKLIYIFLGISFLPAFFPNSFLLKIQLSRTTKVYKKLGVNTINRIAQNGEIVNRLIRKQFPQYKTVTYNARSVKQLLQQTYMNEKFHLILFLFFSFIIVYAICQKEYGWALIIFLTNVGYNIYPNLLQQYIRIKLLNYGRHYNPD